MIHHPAGGYDIRPRRSVACCRLAQERQGLIIEHLLPPHQAAVAVAGVLAEAQIGYHHQVGVLLDRRHCPLDYAPGVVGARAALILVGRQTEEEHRRHPQILQSASLSRYALQALAVLAGHGSYGLGLACPLIHKYWLHQIAAGERVLRHHIPDPRRS